MPDETTQRSSDLIRLMAEAYCQRATGTEGGRHRYAKAMERIVAALETAGYRIVPPAATDA